MKTRIFNLSIIFSEDSLFTVTAVAVFILHTMSFMVIKLSVELAILRLYVTETQPSIHTLCTCYRVVYCTAHVCKQLCQKIKTSKSLIDVPMSAQRTHGLSFQNKPTPVWLVFQDVLKRPTKAVFRKTNKHSALFLQMVGRDQLRWHYPKDPDRWSWAFSRSLMPPAQDQ